MKKNLPRKKVKTIVVASNPVAGIWAAIANSIAEDYHLPKQPRP